MSLTGRSSRMFYALRIPQRTHASHRRHMHLLSRPVQSLISSSPLVSSRHSSLTSPHRTLFIQTQATPNPLSIKFLPGQAVSEQIIDFSSYRAAERSPLAKRLFSIDGVSGALFGPDFISVSVNDTSAWQDVRPHVFAAISEFYASGDPVVRADDETTKAAPNPNAITDDDSDVVAMIKELIETRIRPAVAEDGGDIAYHHFDTATGVVHVQMHGACKGCASSAVTLKNGIENMLMHYVPEVNGVEEWKDLALEAVSDSALHKLEAKLNSIQTEKTHTTPNSTNEQTSTTISSST